MAESLGSHRAPLGPSSPMPREGRHFFDIKKNEGPVLPSPEKPPATISLCSLRLVLRPGSPALVRSWGSFTPHPSCPLQPLSRPQLLVGVAQLRWTVSSGPVPDSGSTPHVGLMLTP